MILYAYRDSSSRPGARRALGRPELGEQRVNTFSTSLDARSAHFQMIRVMIHFVITSVSSAGYIPARGSRRFSLKSRPGARALSRPKL